MTKEEQAAWQEGATLMETEADEYLFLRIPSIFI
jgi:hypothetical protein